VAPLTRAASTGSNGGNGGSGSNGNNGSGSDNGSGDNNFSFSSAPTGAIYTYTSDGASLLSAQS